MISTVMNGGDMLKQAAIRQISDPRLAVTGGNMEMLGGRTYLVFGQNFQGGYNFSFPQMSNSTFTQIYTGDIQSFRIVPTQKSLAIRGYQALHDPVNFRRRDSNLQSVITPSGQRRSDLLRRCLFANPVDAYRSPVVIGASNKARVVASEQQYFDQYSTANIALYNANNHTLASVFMGGISYYDYTYPNGPLQTTVGPPTNSPAWVDDVTDLVQKKNGRDQEYIMPPIPGPGYYGGCFVGLPQSVGTHILERSHQAPTQPTEATRRCRLHLRRDLLDSRADGSDKQHLCFEPGVCGDALANPIVTHGRPPRKVTA